MTVATTVIVPTYNRVEFLGECLNSIFAQTILPTQVIVVDDGSTDGTSALIEGYGSRVTYLRQDNAGKSTALNYAMRFVTGEAIWIFDDDDIADPFALERLTAALDASPHAGFAFGNYDHFETSAGDGEKISTPALPALNTDDLYFSVLLRCLIFQPAMLVRRRCYEEVGPFDPQLFRIQDYEMLIRLSRQFRGVQIPEVVFHQRSHTGVRGPAHMRLYGVALGQRVAALGMMVFDRVREANALSDYLPRSEQPPALSPPLKLKALLRRAAVMARGGCWDHASSDLDEALDFAKSCGLDEAPVEAERAYIFAADQPVLWPMPEFAELIAHAKASPRGSLRTAVMSGLLWPMFREAIKNLARLRLAEGAAGLTSYIRTTTPGAVMRHARHASLLVLHRWEASA